MSGENHGFEFWHVFTIKLLVVKKNLSTFSWIIYVEADDEVKRAKGGTCVFLMWPLSDELKGIYQWIVSNFSRSSGWTTIWSAKLMREIMMNDGIWGCTIFRQINFGETHILVWWWLELKIVRLKNENGWFIGRVNAHWEIWLIW